MRVWASAVLALVAMLDPAPPARPCAGRTGFAAGTVGEVCGRMRDGGTISILENAERPSVLVLDASCAPPHRVLLQSAGRFQIGGIARAADGVLCAVSLDGRAIECFDGSSGRAVRRLDPGFRVQSVWTIGGRLVCARFEARAGQPIVFRESRSGFEEDRTFLSRAAAPDSEIGFHTPGLEAAAMVTNLIQCGLGPPDATPCWRMITGEIRFVGGAGHVPAAMPMPQIAGMSRAFPLRDVLRTPSGVLWLLVNDSSAKKDEPAGPGRRLARLARGRIEVEALDRPARAFLDGDDRGVLILYRDGSAARWEGAAR
jgi:hypothetical protein